MVLKLVLQSGARMIAGGIDQRHARVLHVRTLMDLNVFPGSGVQQTYNEEARRYLADIRMRMFTVVADEYQPIRDIIGEYSATLAQEGAISLEYRGVLSDLTSFMDICVGIVHSDLQRPVINDYTLRMMRNWVRLTIQQAERIRLADNIGGVNQPGFAICVVGFDLHTTVYSRRGMLEMYCVTCNRQAVIWTNYSFLCQTCFDDDRVGIRNVLANRTVYGVIQPFDMRGERYGQLGCIARIIRGCTNIEIDSNLRHPLGYYIQRVYEWIIRERRLFSIRQGRRIRFHRTRYYRATRDLHNNLPLLEYTEEEEIENRCPELLNVLRAIALSSNDLCARGECGCVHSYYGAHQIREFICVTCHRSALLSEHNWILLQRDPEFDRLRAQFQDEDILSGDAAAVGYDVNTEVTEHLREMDEVPPLILAGPENLDPHRNELELVDFEDYAAHIMLEAHNRPLSGWRMMIDFELDHDLTCSICGEETTMGAYLCPNNHGFHLVCLMGWYEVTIGTCPNCRIDMDTLLPRENPDGLD